MTTTISQTVFSPWLTPVRLISTANIAGTYSNGPNNNGVGATLVISATSLTVDGVLCSVGDRLLLQTQTNTFEQGIYVVKSIGTTVVLERSDDFQSIEQMKAGQYLSVGAGSGNAGSVLTLVEPVPQHIGVDAIVFSDVASGITGVTFSGGASTANALAVFSNTSGDLKAASGATTLGQSLAVTGTITATQITLAKANGTEAGNAVTANGNAGVITTSALTTAGAATYAITWTNSFITATSVISLTIQGGTNTVQNVSFKVVAGSGTATLTIYNTSTVADATPLNGTILIGYTVL
jgi:hypothetical protein